MFANIIFVVLTFMPNLFQWLNLLCFLYPDFYYCSRSITIIWASRISLLGLIIPILSTFKTRNSGMILCTDEAHQSLIILYAQVLYLFQNCQKKHLSMSYVTIWFKDPDLFYCVLIILVILSVHIKSNVGDINASFSNFLMGALIYSWRHQCFLFYSSYGSTYYYLDSNHFSQCGLRF